MNWLKPPFNMLISGITNCGKSEYALKLLSTTYKGVFDYIIVFCPSFHENKAYNLPFIFKDDKIIIMPNIDLNKSLEAAIKTFRGSNVLFLIDDCANLPESKQKASELTKLAMHGRHDGISVWFISQKYNAVVKDFRDNIRMLILYYNKDDDALKDALSENNIIPIEKRKEIINYLRNNKYSKIIMRLEQPFDYRIE